MVPNAGSAEAVGLDRGNASLLRAPSSHNVDIIVLPPTACCRDLTEVIYIRALNKTAKVYYVCQW